MQDRRTAANVPEIKSQKHSWIGWATYFSNKNVRSSTIYIAISEYVYQGCGVGVEVRSRSPEFADFSPEPESESEPEK